MKKTLFLFAIILLHKFTLLAAFRLKLRVHHEKGNAKRQFKVDLEINVTREGEGMCHYYKNVKIDKNFEIRLKSRDDREKYGFCFHMYTSPIEDEFDQQENDQLPYKEEENNIEMDNIRQMFKSVEMTLFAPMPSKRYVINLGSLEPKKVWWNRRVLISPDNDLGNYHAFLYAKVTKTERYENPESEKRLLADAPLIKKANDKVIDSTSQQQNKFSEYFLSIPVNLTRLFKHKIWYNELRIYRYEESKFLINPKKEANNEMPTKENVELINCSICLEPMINEQIIIKLHGEKNKSSKKGHIFHKNCIKKWFNAHEKFRCPLCNQELKIEMRAMLPAIFSANATNFHYKIQMNSMAELIKIANEKKLEKNFKQRQAQKYIEEILATLKGNGKALKKLLTEIHLERLAGNLKEIFVELKNGKLMENNRSLEKIEKEIDQFMINVRGNDSVGEEEKEKAIEKAEKAMNFLEAIRNGQLLAQIALQNLKTITEEEKRKGKAAKFGWIMSRFKTKH